MAKNLRQKYKDLKKRLNHIDQYRSLRKPVVERNNIQLQTYGVTRTIDTDFMDNMPDAVLTDIAFDIAKQLVKDGMIDISEKRDPYREKVFVKAKLIVGTRNDA